MIEECINEIVDSFEKNGYYVDNNSIFSKCYGQAVPNIMKDLMINHNITNVSKITNVTFVEKGYGKMIGFNRVIYPVYFIKKD
jgi:hypothetical protein